MYWNLVKEQLQLRIWYTGFPVVVMEASDSLREPKIFAQQIIVDANQYLDHVPGYSIKPGKDISIVYVPS